MRTRTVICWLLAPVITDKCRVFGGRFYQKSLAGALIATTVWRPTSNMSRHREWLTTWLRQINLFIGYVCFTTPRLFFQLAMSKKITILSLDQRIEVLCRMDEAHHVERLLPSQCGKNANGTYDIKTDREGHRGLRWLQVFAYYSPTIPQLLRCINFSFTNYRIHNYDNACIQYEYRWWR